MRDEAETIDYEYDGLAWEPQKAPRTNLRQHKLKEPAVLKTHEKSTWRKLLNAPNERGPEKGSKYPRVYLYLFLTQTQESHGLSLAVRNTSAALCEPGFLCSPF